MKFGNLHVSKELFTRLAIELLIEDEQHLSIFADILSAPVAFFTLKFDMIL